MRRSYYKFKNAILCIVDAWEVGCVKDFQPCASPWLQPTNVEFVRMVFFILCCSRPKPGSMCVSQHSPTYKNTPSVDCFLASPRHSARTRHSLLAAPSLSGTNLALVPYKLTLLRKPVLVTYRNHITTAVTE